MPEIEKLSFNKTDVASLLIDLFSEMIFVHGFIHAGRKRKREGEREEIEETYKETQKQRALGDKKGSKRQRGTVPSSSASHHLCCFLSS